MDSSPYFHHKITTMGLISNITAPHFQKFSSHFHHKIITFWVHIFTIKWFPMNNLIFCVLHTILWPISNGKNCDHFVIKMLRHISGTKLYFCDENVTNNFKKLGLFLTCEVQFFATVEIKTNIMGILIILCIHRNRLVIV